MVLYNNTLRGLSVGSGTTAGGQNIVYMVGTPANPVTVVGNGNRGIRTELSTGGVAPQFKTMQDVIVTDNGVYGVELNEVAHENGVGPIDHCLFARNGDTLTSPAQIRIGDTNAAAAPAVSVTKSTFHRAGRSVAVTSGSHFLISFGGTDALTYGFTDCLFSGNTTDRAIYMSSGDNNIVNLTNCSLVGTGPDALNPVPNVIEVAATGCAMNQTAVITLDANYKSTATNPVVGDSFDIGNVNYGGKGSIAQPQPLSGWGDSIGDVPVTISAFIRRVSVARRPLGGS